mgnify:FL=1
MLEKKIEKSGDQLGVVRIREDLGKPLPDGVWRENQDVSSRQEVKQTIKICTVVRTFPGHGNGESGLRHFLSSWMGQQV